MAVLTASESGADWKADPGMARRFRPLSKTEMAGFARRFAEEARDGRHEHFKSTQVFDGPYHRKQHGFDV